MKGFTLIELLVVVLIIGVLSAVALPQYQRAVEKSRLAAVMPLLDNVCKAQQAYYMANGVYTADMDALDIHLPWTDMECKGWCSAAKQAGFTVSTRSNTSWMLVNGVSNTNEKGLLVALSPKSAIGAAFTYQSANAYGIMEAGFYCLERSDLSLSKDYCKKIGWTKVLRRAGHWTYYVQP